MQTSPIRAREASLLVTVALGLAMAFLLGWSMAGKRSMAVHAQPSEGIVRVATTGDDVPGCGGEAAPCRTVQYAIDAAHPGDEVRLAGGTYTGVNNRGGLAQVVYLSKTLTIRGGYTTTNWLASDPVANPTTLDAGSQGRVLYASGAITVEVEGLRLTGGNATGLGGTSWTRDVGGGLYVYAATVVVRDSWIYSNVASTARWGSGGGLYFWGSDAALSNNTIMSNTASAVGGFGGGLYLDKCTATLQDNQVQGNIASTGNEGFGGGIYLLLGEANLRGNRVQGNVASAHWAGDGGGLYLFGTEARLEDNTVQGNTASTGWDGRGGGLHLCTSAVALIENRIVGNTASTASMGSGGGLWFCTSNAQLVRNEIADNVGSAVADGYGGGLVLTLSDAVFSGNQVLGNTAALSATAIGQGGALWVQEGSSFTLTNDLIAGNQAGFQGSGLWLGSYETEERTTARLLHTTIADNGGISQGIFVDLYANLSCTNTIIAGHADVGLVVSGGSTATLEATLWYENGLNVTGVGTIDIGAINVYDAPDFVDPAAGDYHLGPSSAALDRGLDTGIVNDIDDQPRPYAAPDLGADEYWPPGVLQYFHLPLVTKNRW